MKDQTFNYQTMSGENDWPEGSYTGKCVKCGCQYVGPKRSLICYTCLPKKENKVEDSKA